VRGWSQGGDQEDHQAPVHGCDSSQAQEHGKEHSLETKTVCLGLDTLDGPGKQ
jgi:hypothetical protein